jgi:hypothetical protein
VSAALRAAADPSPAPAAVGVTIRGVEEPLPAGERLLWQGRPSARAVARHVFHLRGLAAYFALVVAAQVVLAGGATPAGVAYLACALGALGVFAAVSVWVARSTVYAITTRRVVLKVGMAMPMTLNVPLRCVAGAAVREWGDGTGEIVLALDGADRFAYFLLWPHARPWRLRRPEPALRGLAEPRLVGALLREAAAGAEGAPIAGVAMGATVAAPVATPRGPARPARRLAGMP